MLLPLLASLALASAPGWAIPVSGLVKVRPGQLPPRHPAQLHAARGECEGFQLVTTRPASEVSARASPLRDEAKHTLPLALYREAFVELATASNAESTPGLWPDPLIPERDGFVHEARDAFPADATRAPVVVFAEVCVPRDATPGRYRGEVVLGARGLSPVHVPVSLRVDPFELPATSSLPNAFGLSLYSVARGHHLAPDSKEAHALLDRYASLLLSHRLTAMGMSFTPPPLREEDGQRRFDFSAYDAQMAPFLEGRALPSGARFTTALLVDSPKLPEDARVDYYRAFREHFAQKGWPQEIFFYAKDEPRPQDYPRVQAEAKPVRRAGGLSVLVTSPLAKPLLGSTDVFCPVLNCFFPRPGPKTCPNPLTAAELRRRIPSWAHVWWYQSCLSHGCNGGPLPPDVARAFTGWASYVIDQSVPRNRAMGPLAFLEGIEGELYYDTVLAYDGPDPWTHLYAFGGNGDGTLLYPGDPARIGGRTPIPLASLRLKAIRDGLEDYEYLVLARSLGLNALAEKSVQALVRSGYEITDDPTVWEETRDALATALSAAWARKYARAPGVQR